MWGIFSKDPATNLFTNVNNFSKKFWHVFLLGWENEFVCVCKNLVSSK